MPKISIVDRNAQEYQSWLSPETPDHLTPRALSSELVLVHEWHPGHHDLEHRINRTHTTCTSTGAGFFFTEVVAAPATGYVRLVIAASGFSTNWAAYCGVGSHNTALGAPTFANLASLTEIAGATQGRALTRMVLLQPGWDAVWWAYADAAGKAWEVEAIWADYLCCEPLPRW